MIAAEAEGEARGGCRAGHHALERLQELRGALDPHVGQAVGEEQHGPRRGDSRSIICRRLDQLAALEQPTREVGRRARAQSRTLLERVGTVGMRDGRERDGHLDVARTLR